MDRIPLELLHRVFALCCTDEHTGPALTLVSRRFRDISAPYRLQSVFLRGNTTISKFAAHLQRVPVQFRRTRYLFILSNPTGTVRPPLEVLLPNYPLPDPEDKERTRAFHAEHRTEYREALRSWEQAQDAILMSSITTILAQLRPTLNSLALFVYTKGPIPPWDLDALESLTMRCSDLLHPAQRLPALRRLHITLGGFGPLTPTQLAVQAPALTHLRYSGVALIETFPATVAAALGLPYPFPVEMDGLYKYSHAVFRPVPPPAAPVLPHLRVLLVHPRYGTRQDYTEPRRLVHNSLLPGLLMLMAQDPQRRFALLEGNLAGGAYVGVGGEYRMEDGEGHWRDWIEGGEGCWKWEDWRDNQGQWREWIDFEGFTYGD